MGLTVRVSVEPDLPESVHRPAGAVPLSPEDATAGRRAGGPHGPHHPTGQSAHLPTFVCDPSAGIGHGHSNRPNAVGAQGRGDDNDLHPRHEATGRRGAKSAGSVTAREQAANNAHASNQSGRCLTASFAGGVSTLARVRRPGVQPSATRSRGCGLSLRTRRLDRHAGPKRTGTFAVSATQSSQTAPGQRLFDPPPLHQFEICYAVMCDLKHWVAPSAIRRFISQVQVLG